MELHVLEPDRAAVQRLQASATQGIVIGLDCRITGPQVGRLDENRLQVQLHSRRRGRWSWGRLRRGWRLRRQDLDRGRSREKIATHERSRSNHRNDEDDRSGDVREQQPSPSGRSCGAPGGGNRCGHGWRDGRRPCVRAQESLNSVLQLFSCDRARPLQPRQRVDSLLGGDLHQRRAGNISRQARWTELDNCRPFRGGNPPDRLHPVPAVWEVLQSIRLSSGVRHELPGAARRGSRRDVVTKELVADQLAGRRVEVRRLPREVDQGAACRCDEVLDSETGGLKRFL